MGARSRGGGWWCSATSRGRTWCMRSTWISRCHRANATSRSWSWRKRCLSRLIRDPICASNRARRPHGMAGWGSAGRRGGWDPGREHAGEGIAAAGADGTLHQVATGRGSLRGRRARDRRSVAGEHGHGATGRVCGRARCRRSNRYDGGAPGGGDGAGTVRELCVLDRFQDGYRPIGQYRKPRTD